MEPGTYMSDNSDGTSEDGRLKMSYGYVTTQVMKAHMMSLVGIMYSFLLRPQKMIHTYTFHIHRDKPLLIYGAETWTWTKVHASRLMVAEMGF
jgi:hypothetical protein